jgi:predicted ATP-binding protein involved in virulence
MRIDRIEIRNFKRFEKQSLELHPRFTLLVGDNGAGKTTLLDALAVAAGVWLVKVPDSTLVNCGRNIMPEEIRLVPEQVGDRVQFLERKPVSVRAEGVIAGQEVEWTRQIREAGSRTTNADAGDALDLVAGVYADDEAGADVLCPVIGYYGAGRAWLPSRERRQKAKVNGPARRWEAFYDCFDERIRLGDLQTWFQREAIEYANRRGSWRPGYEVVKRAVLRCIPGSSDLWFDGDRSEVVVLIDGTGVPFSLLSAGQKMMVALIADIAVKAVTQNAWLLPSEKLGPEDESWPRVLRNTPGLVLLDEVDVHLHPKWQRRVVSDLKETFPLMQFVSTSHSPFIIQSLEPGELRTIGETGPQLVEYANRSIDDIAEEIQNVEVPQMSEKARVLADATERYFKLLQRGHGVSGANLNDAEIEYRQAAERYSANPGLSAVLKLEAMAKQKEQQGQ